MRSLLLAASVGAALTGSAEAETNPANPRAYLTGDDLFDWCRASSHDECWGYVSGIADAMSVAGAGLGRRACIPDSVRISQAADIVQRFLLDHPEQRHFAAPGLVAPCPGGRLSVPAVMAGGDGAAADWGMGGDRAVSDSVDLPRFRGGVRAWDQDI